MTRKRLREERSPRPMITVTETHIATAKRRDSSHCMIADAVKDAVSGARSVSVDLQSIRWTDRDKGIRYTYLTPRVGQIALVLFDQGDENIKPFSFRLRDAMVTKARTKGPETESQQSIPSKAMLEDPNGSSSTQRKVAVRIGGKTPPIGPLSNHPKANRGKRRAFGLRGLME